MIEQAQNKKILVTGHLGFIGFHCVKKLLDNGLNVIGIDSLNDYYDVSLKESRLTELNSHKNKNFKSIIHNLAKKDTKELLKEISPNIVINLAAQAGVRHSLEHPEDYIENNIYSYLNILEYAKANDVEKIVMKIESAGNNKITITERGTCFGYRDLMVDPRSFLILKKLNYPVFFDVGHSVRKNGFPSSNIKEGGQKEFGETYARSAISNFVDGLFIEVHPDPKNAKCDAATQFSFNEFEKLLTNVKPLWDFVNSKSN